MIHGFRGTHHGLLLIARYFIKDYEVIIPDIPGFGSGERLRSYGITAYTNWLDRYIKRLNLRQKPILLGHSFGSVIASSYVAGHPKSVSRLILVNPIGAPALDGPRRVLTKLSVLYYEIGAKFPEKLARHWLGSKLVVRLMTVVMTKTDDPEIKKYIYDQHFKHFSSFHSAKSVLASFRTSVSHDVSEYADKITVPTLLIAGSLDDITSLSQQYLLVKKFPKGRLAVIDNVGHLTHYETPGKVSTIIKRWLRQLNS